jgi:putative redox protein
MDEKIALAVIGKETYRTELRARKHVLIADEPPDAGGKDLGPRPQDFLNMSLASCTAITLRMYANRKNFDVAQIKVEVSGREEAGKTLFQTDIVITGNLSEEEKDQMLQISRRCPVHKAMSRPIEIETLLTVNPV